MATYQITGPMFAEMIAGGTANLGEHAQSVNALNVFPIPDGDTGDNMSMTMQGGTGVSLQTEENLSDTAAQMAKGMLLGARGNSGVILSQFFAGMADGFRGLETADVRALETACEKGVERAYRAVMTPTEGTILTVAKDATRYACAQKCGTVEEFYRAFLEEARRSLERTPDLLDVLKEAGVVDSGGAGFIYIMEGMLAYLSGEAPELRAPAAPAPAMIDPDLFREDSVLEFGYCTELLIRLQTCKTDLAAFDTAMITGELEKFGNSIVAFQTESIVKLHVHTMEPWRVLQHCQKYGEFLTVKIENMMLQHNEVLQEKQAQAPEAETAAEEARPRRPFGVIAVATGDGIRTAFSDMGADEVISGGQTMNPSSEDFIAAFRRVNADVIFVLPNNGNVILAARQAATLFEDADVRVIPTKTIGDGYAVLSMLDPDSKDPDAIEQEMQDAMSGVLTAEITRSVRDTVMMGHDIKTGDYLGILGKNILANGKDPVETVVTSVAGMQPEEHGVLLLLCGKDAKEDVTAKIESTLRARFPMTEVCVAEGGQDVYEYIVVAE